MIIVAKIGSIIDDRKLKKENKDVKKVFDASINNKELKEIVNEVKEEHNHEEKLIQIQKPKEEK